MDDDAPLHPNLARLAATYDQVSSDWAAGRITLAAAQQRLSSLIARDDQGARWRLDPSSGEWQRQNADGSWEEAPPPTWGLSTPDGWDLSGGVDPFADPRRYIDTRAVDVNRVTDDTSLSGVTFRASAAAAGEPPEPVESRMAKRTVMQIGAVILIAVLLVVGVARCNSNRDSEGPGHTTETTQLPLD